MTQEEVLPPPHRLEACCRLCLSGDEPRSTSLFLFPVPPGHPAGPEDHSPPSPSSVTEQRLLIEMILECTSIQVRQTDTHSPAARPWSVRRLCVG